MVGETVVMSLVLLVLPENPTFSFGNAGLLRLFRLLRLTRMARMLRSMPERLDKALEVSLSDVRLMILIKGMAAATTSAPWPFGAALEQLEVFFIMSLQLILLYVFAIAAKLSS